MNPTIINNHASLFIKSQETLLEQVNELIQGCISMNRFSQSRLYNLFAPKMMIVCLRYSNSKEEAEDILQEGFIKVFTFIHQYKFTGSFEGWVRKIIVNCALQRLRSKSTLFAVTDIESVNTEVSDKENIISQISSKELLQMVQQLPPAYKMVFNLYVFEGMKHREIAELLGITEGTSKSNLSDARLSLQKAVTKSLEVKKQNSIYL